MIATTTIILINSGWKLTYVFCLVEGTICPISFVKETLVGPFSFNSSDHHHLPNLSKVPTCTRKEHARKENTFLSHTLR
jgi:methionine salvage enolase-phosphatase E1